MSYSELARTAPRRIARLLGAGLLVAVAAVGAARGYRLLPASSPPPAAPSALPRREPPRQAVGEAASPAGLPPRPPRQAATPVPAPIALPPDEDGAPGAAPIPAPIGLPPDEDGAPGAADGVVPDGTTVFDDALPGVAALDPALLGALRQAAADAAADGVTFYVTSGWRSPAYQDQLLREAVATYGSAEEAARWVATAATSPHVAGAAIDIGGFDAMAWLAERGAAYGLCQIYGNEPWHYELRPAAIDHGCPPMYADPTLDPRMRQ